MRRDREVSCGEKMRALILLGVVATISEGSLQHINDHHGHPFRPSAEAYKRHEMPSPQPPFQIVENQSISKRRLDVWKPISSDTSPEAPKLEPILPTVESTTGSYWSPQKVSTESPSSLGESPQRAYVQLTASGPTATANFAPKQTLKIKPAPTITSQQALKVLPKAAELRRPRPQAPLRPPPPPRQPAPPQKAFLQVRGPPPKGRRPPRLPGYPTRKGLFRQAQDRQDTGFLERRPILIAPSKKAKKKFLKPLTAPFTFSKPPLPLKEVLVIRDNDKEPRRAVDPVDVAGFEDLLLHLDKFKEDDDYLPNKPTKPTKPTKQTTKAPAPKKKRKTLPRPPKPPKPEKISGPPKPPKLNEEADKSPKPDKPPSPPPLPPAKEPAPPLFPTIQVQREDVLKALDAVDQSVAPLIHAASVISNSLSLAPTQSVEEVLDNERQDDEEPLDGVVETIKFTAQEILAKPEPLIILSAVLLSVITGSAIGNTITTMRSATTRNEEDEIENRLECPRGYEVVFMDSNGMMLRMGSIVNVRMKRESLETTETESGIDLVGRRGYPFRKVTKQVVLDNDTQEKEGESQGSYYCKKLGDTGDASGSKGVGIRVNSEENQGGGQGQVSIKVGGVNVIVGESDKPSIQLARENPEDEEYFEESDEERDIDPADDVEIGGVVDVFIESA